MSENQPSSQPKTFWQTVADPKHPFWKFIYVLLIVPAMLLTVSSFDETELTTLVTWAGGSGGLFAILKLLNGWVNKDHTEDQNQ